MNKRRRSSDERSGCCKCHTPSVHDFCDRTTWHGVSDFYQSNGIGRVFWGVAIVAAFVASCYGCYAIVAQYRQSPVVISYMIHPSEGGRPLPDIVICPFNRFNQSFLNDYDVPEDLLEYIQSAFSLNTPYEFQRNHPLLPVNMTGYALAFDRLLQRMSNISFEEFIKRASFSCSSLIKYCVYPSGITNCCSTAKSVVTPVGRCYRLQGPNQISSGFGFGMAIVITVPSDQYLSIGRNNLQNQGVSVKLAEAGKGLDFDLTFIPAGVHALMPLRATRYEFINDPPRYECFGKVSRSYSSVRCFDDCFFKPGMDKCKCRHVTSPNTHYRACKPDEFFHCLVVETMAAMRNSSDNEYVKTCRRNCMTPCAYWAFHPTVSYAKFPSAAFYHYVDRRESHVWDRTIILDVFYEKLEYTLIKHFPSMTPDTFIANIGGQVGLWVGGSVLSLAQLIVFAIHYSCSRAMKMREESKSQNLQKEGGDSDQRSKLNGEASGNYTNWRTSPAMQDRGRRSTSPIYCNSRHYCCPEHQSRMRSELDDPNSSYPDSFAGYGGFYPSSQYHGENKL